MAEQNTLRETSPQGPRRCLGCGYVIDHLPEPRCPECGQEFDLSDSETYWTRPTDTREATVRRLIGAVAVILLGLIVMVAQQETVSRRSYLLYWLSGLCAFAALGVGFVSLSGLLHTLTDATPPWARRGIGYAAMKAAAAISALIAVVTILLAFLFALVAL